MLTKPSETEVLCLSDIRGQETTKRAMEVAASGNHTLLIIGGSGQGKSALLSLQGGLMGELNKREVPWHEVRPNDEAVPFLVEHHDIVVTMGDLPASDWFLPPPGETTEEVRLRVAKVRGNYHKVGMDAEAGKLFLEAYGNMRLNPRKADAVERVANTLAVMDHHGRAKFVARLHVAEALSYIHQVLDLEGNTG